MNRQEIQHLYEEDKEEGNDFYLGWGWGMGKSGKLNKADHSSASISGTMQF